MTPEINVGIGSERILEVVLSYCRSIDVRRTSAADGMHVMYGGSQIDGGMNRWPEIVVVACHNHGRRLLRCGVDQVGGQHRVEECLRKGPISPLAMDSAINAARRKEADMRGFLEMLQWFVTRSHATSYIAENTGALAVRLLEVVGNGTPIELEGFVFPQDGLVGRQFGNVRFRDCQFQSTSLEGVRLGGCRFIECTMHGLAWPKGFAAGGAVVQGGSVASVSIGNDGNGVYAPSAVRQAMRGAGFKVKEPASAQDEPAVEPNSDTRLAERAFRVFLNATFVGEDVFRLRCGGKASQFFADVLPKMLDAGVLEEVEGVRKHRRFKLQVPMHVIAAAIPARVETLDEPLVSIRGGS